MSDPLTFGLFPLGLAGAPGGVASGAPDDFAQIERAVGLLQGDGPPLLISGARTLPPPSGSP